MLSDGRLWIGVVLGAAGYHFFAAYRAKKAAG